MLVIIPLISHSEEMCIIKLKLMIEKYEDLLIGISLWSTFSFFVGGVDIPLESLSILILLDILTGVLGAIRQCNINAHKFTTGVLRKISLFFVVGVSVMIDHTTGDVFHLRSLTIALLGTGEGLSICENIVTMGFGDILPPSLVKHLKLVQKEIKNNG